MATGFKLRPDKLTGLIDVYLEDNGHKSERISLDPFLIRSNWEILKKYAATLAVEQDDSTQKEDIIVSDQSNYANIVSFAQMSGRAETIFGVFSTFDWIEATKQTEGGKAPEIRAIDNIVAMSSAGMQKKLIMEIVLTISQLARR